MGRLCLGRNAGVFCLLVLILLLVRAPESLGADGPVSPQETPPPPLDLSQPLASVNGIPVLVWELLRRLEDRIPRTGHATVSPERLGEMRREILETLIIEEVLVQEARREKISLSQRDVKTDIREIEGRFPSPEAYQQALSKRGMTSEMIREGVKRHLLIRQLTQEVVYSQITISNEAMFAYYEKNKEQFVIPEQIRLRIILISVKPESTSEQWIEAREKSEGIVEKARAGEDFKNMVREFSGDTRIPEERVGETALLHQGRLPYKELEGVVFKEETGAIGGPVQSLYGYLVFRVEEKKPSQGLTFEQLNKKLLEKEMRSSQAGEKLKLWIDGLRAEADIKIF